MSKKSKMCVIGFGRMGKRCAKVFSEGFEVEVISRRDIRSEAGERGATQSDDPASAYAGCPGPYAGDAQRPASKTIVAGRVHWRKGTAC